MTPRFQENEKALRVLNKSVKKHIPAVRRKLRSRRHPQQGSLSDQSAVVNSAAKYYEALRKLANE